MKYPRLVIARRGLILGGAIFILLSLAGCDKLGFLNLGQGKTAKQIEPTIADRGTLIARVGTVPITLEDLNQEIEAYNSQVPADRPEEKITTREKKIEFLKNDLVRRALLYQAALDRGLDKRDDAARAIEKAKMEILVLELIREEAGKVEVSSKEIEEYYETYKDQLKEPEERQIREIVVNSEPEARDILIQLLQGGDFATLAKERSKAASAKNGGDLGFIKPGDRKSQQFDQIAFSESLEAGRVSNIFKGPEGYYILKLEAKRGGKLRSLSEMWDDIKRALTFLKQQEKINGLVGKLSRDLKIEIREGEIR